jgi:TPR repeat protein
MGVGAWYIWQNQVNDKDVDVAIDPATPTTVVKAANNKLVNNSSVNNSSVKQALPASETLVAKAEPSADQIIISSSDQVNDGAAEGDAKVAQNPPVDEALQQRLRLLRKTVLDLELRSNNGDLDAQLELASMYQVESSEIYSIDSAINWYQRAASQQSAEAYYKLAEFYYLGRGVDIDPSQALTFWRLAAESGQALAQTRLGGLYQQGEMVEQSYSKALQWYQLAAQQGEVSAQRNLGVMYEFGTAGEPDFDNAIKWYDAAALQGDLEAMLYKRELIQKLSTGLSASQLVDKSQQVLPLKNSVPVEANEVRPGEPASPQKKSEVSPSEQQN